MYDPQIIIDVSDQGPMRPRHLRLEKDETKTLDSKTLWRVEDAIKTLARIADGC